MTAPEERSGGFDANARGIAVLVVAVLIGMLLLWKAGDTGGSTPAASTGTTTTIAAGSITTTPDDTTTTTKAATGDHQPADVDVLVLNGSGFAGVAKTNSDAIGEKGFNMLTPANAAAIRAETIVYYADGYQSDAEAVASALGLESSVVDAMPSTSPGPGADAANVVVVLGQNTPQN